LTETVFKRGMEVEGLARYVRNDRFVLAKRMKVPFVIETGQGWNPLGKRGDWLVLIGGDLWAAVEDEQFRKIYRPYDEGRDCIGPCDAFVPERRSGKEDRRRWTTAGP
jgi:hypothetical protein